MTLPHTSVFRCGNRRCDLQFAAPQLSDHELAQAYAALYYRPDGSTAVHGNTPDVDNRYLLDHIAARFGPVSGKRVLDYGCGVGTLLKVAKDCGAQPIGIEQSDAARETIRREGLADVFADIAALRKADPAARFDWIILGEVIEHLRRPWEDLAQLREVLAPGGHIVVVTPNALSLRSRLHGRQWDQRLNLTHFYYFTRRSLSAVFVRGGLAPEPLPPITFYSDHGFLRRQLQRALRTVGMQGDLIFSATAPAWTVAPIAQPVSTHS